jgi:ribonuclease HII
MYLYGHEIVSVNKVTQLLNYLLLGRTEAGCDEAGRGCLAGPVVAAAVILNPEKPIDGLNDSKKLSADRRRDLAFEIKQKTLSWAIGIAEPAEIDELNILKASFLAMHRAIQKLLLSPEFLLIDGNRFISFPGIPHSCIVKGDGIFQSIAAASILAKTHRDELMQDLHLEMPYYNWCKNKGYPTAEHTAAIERHGLSHYHRLSFRKEYNLRQLKIPLQ